MTLFTIPSKEQAIESTTRTGSSAVNLGRNGIDSRLYYYLHDRPTAISGHRHPFNGVRKS